MDSRKETRFEGDQEVAVTLLGDTEIGLAGRIVNVSGKGMCLALDRAMPVGGAIKIDLADTLILAEVVYCRARGESFQVGIVLEQALYHTTELEALLERLLGPASQPTKPVGVTSLHCKTTPPARPED